MNWTTYKLSPTFFLSAYIHHVMIAQLTAPESILLHMRPAYKPPLIPGIIPLKRKCFEPGLHTLAQEFVPPEPTLSTLNNVALAATHFAHILGGRMHRLCRGRAAEQSAFFSLRAGHH